MTLQEPIVAPAADPVSPLAPALPAAPADARRVAQGVLDHARRPGHPRPAPDLAHGAAQGLAALLVPRPAADLPRSSSGTVPILGNVVAFRRFRPGGSMFGDEWVGLYYVKMFINDQQFWHAFTNTVIIGILTLLIVFPLPILLALLLNEVRSRHFKRSIQTISYLPHFMSVVIVAGVVFQLTAVNGTVNQIITALGGQAITFMQDPGWFRPIYLSSEVWQTVGWGTILYLAALTTIDEQLYEAARIDGANRWQQTWHITLPGIRPTMIVLLILNVGTFMAVGFEKILLLSNPLIYSTADVISTYLFRVGIVSNSISYATAIGLFEAIIGVDADPVRQRDLQEDRGGEPVVTTDARP